MKFVDLAAQQERIRDRIEANIHAVLDHGQYIMGPEVAELERRLETFCNVKHAVSCASGTDALLLALLALDVRTGDAVFTTPFTFIATAEVIQLIGAVPIFVDIDPKTFNLDPSKLLQAVTALRSQDTTLYPLPRFEVGSAEIKPKAVIAVDLFGLPADYEQINGIAADHNLHVIEDAAQSFGARHQGRPAGSLAGIACTSFFPAKPLGCYGDGGMCFTDNDALAGALQSLRIHGKGTNKYDNIRIGINGRLDTLQAAILMAKFDIFKNEIIRRRQITDRYSQLLADSGLTTPHEPDGLNSVWAQYSLLAKDSQARQRIQDRLSKTGIPSVVYYPIPLHLQTAFNNLGYAKGDFPISEDCSQRIFSLPMHPYLTPEQQTRIAKAVIGNE